MIALANLCRARVSRGLRRPNTQRMRHVFNPEWVAIVAVVALLHACASAQHDGDLQQQLQQLKQQYEQTTKELQQRIAVLEQELQEQNEAATQEKEAATASDEATVSAVE